MDCKHDDTKPGEVCELCGQEVPKAEKVDKIIVEVEDVDAVHSVIIKKKE